jgi:hypothetical protein
VVTDDVGNRVRLAADRRHTSDFGQIQLVKLVKYLGDDPVFP